MDLSHRANCATLNPFPYSWRSCVSSGAEKLCCHPGCPSGIASCADLVQDIRNWLVCDDMFPFPHSPNCDHPMQMFRSDDVHRVDILFFLQHLADIDIGPTGR